LYLHCFSILFFWEKRFQVFSGFFHPATYVGELSSANLAILPVTAAMCGMPMRL